ncbi:ANTAR domain-containing protein [Streptomyces sp. SDr-06]|uniref:ANTAR domain-containing protein n=1 Tax=Streptomyces sp. SDr-06 TaxID=2267702 RepID=UPI000DEA615F|nr:GAF and ANTAR domain-containing protein [Streptomyces sp. SDr-06]RCH59637.1 ANTAR domain-containing protein [Streptomyces sp. SDr-06]
MSVTPRDVLAAQSVLDLASRADGFDILELLHDLTMHTVRLLGVRSAGVTILDAAGAVDYLTASDEMCRRLEEDQLELGEGPCLDAARTGEPLAPVLLRTARPSTWLWPRFTHRALRAGITSVAAVPLRTPAYPLGAVNLMSSGRLPTREDLCLAQVLADAAGSCLHHRQTPRTKNEIIGQLERALQSRIVIEQAKGVLASRLAIGVEEAFTRLRSHARSQRRKLTDIATEVARGAIPAELDTTR